MACKTSFELHHNFPKLAEESGFTFNTHKPRVHIEWNKIKLIDIESLIRERKFVIVEQHINDILDCVLESEFDVRILDDGVLKIFRLAQLAVEYQQFCRHYLDRSVYVLREEVTNLLKELDTTKKNLIEKEDEIRRMRRKTKQYVRNPLPYGHYGNENIATMLLKTLNQTKGDIFGSSSQADAVYHNKCNYCEKVFLNQLYLKSHMSRRHANILEMPQKDTTDKNITNEDNHPRVNEEIADLKLQLTQMQELIANTHNYNRPITNVDTQIPEQNNVKDKPISKNENAPKEMKDAAVLTNEDEYLLEKIQAWKKEENEKYNKEISLLRNQIIDIVSKKEKEDQSTIGNELKIMEQLQMTIKQQGAEIIALKQELLKEENNEKERRKEIEKQLSYWMKQTELQSKVHKALLQKLNEVANEAKAYKAQVDAEKEKSIKLQEMLEERLSRDQLVMKDSPKISSTLNKSKSKEYLKSENSNTFAQSYPTADLNTLKILQQQAQELLNIDQISSTDSSSICDEKSKANLTKYETKTQSKVGGSFKNSIKSQQNTRKSKEKRKKVRNFEDKETKKVPKIDNSYEPKSNTALYITKKENGYVHIPGSPMKVVRAKITEEVNHRLTSLGVDPLKNRIPQSIFQKQRTLIQKQRESKAKKLPIREKVLHSIITHLDQNTSSNNDSQNEIYISPSKSHKSFSLSSMFTNVKTKALSLVKSNDSINKSEKSYNDVAKRAMALLKTPPGSGQSSPLKYSEHLTPDKHANEIMKAKKEGKKSMFQYINNTETEVNDETDTIDSDITTADDELPKDRATKTINFLIKSPIRRPDNAFDKEYKDDKFNPKHEANNKSNIVIDSDDIRSTEITPRKCFSQENINNPKQTKGVLKNASSTSSLNKKKVLFDMDAIQMKSLSASPSQSITEKSENNDEQLESGVVNLDTDEWDISSIENEPTNSATKVQVTSHISPKIAELKKNIELKLHYRSPTLSTALVGGVDVMAAPMQKDGSLRGSNTSLGSSILDDTDDVPVQNNTFFRQSKIPEKDDSEIEISDLINDAVNNTLTKDAIYNANPTEKYKGNRKTIVYSYIYHRYISNTPAQVQVPFFCFVK